MTRRTDDTVFVAGHRGMVGSAIVRRLQALGHGTTALERGLRESGLWFRRAVLLERL